MKLLRVRGLHTPRLCLWLLGWSHRLLRTGCLDRETGRAESAYMTGQVKRFQSAAVLRLSKSEKSAAPLFAEADKLLLRLPYLDAALLRSRGPMPQMPSSGRRTPGRRSAANGPRNVSPS